MSLGELQKRFLELSKLSEKGINILEDHLKNAPDWLMDQCSAVLLSPDTTFIREDEPLTNVYLLLEGTVKALDYRALGFEYEFVQFGPGYAFGGMEVIMDIDYYCTTLRTVQRCLFIKIPYIYYSSWLQSDFSAFKHEAKLVGEYLLEQGRLARSYLFLSAPQRLAKVLVNKYVKNSKNGVLIDHSTRQELSNEVGVGIRTITRSVKQLCDEGYITKSDVGITVNYEQYCRLKEMISKIIVADIKLI